MNAYPIPETFPISSPGAEHHPLLFFILTSQTHTGCVFTVYIKKNYAKLELALARGKKLYDHRETLKKRDISRQTERELKE